MSISIVRTVVVVCDERKRYVTELIRSVHGFDGIILFHCVCRRRNIVNSVTLDKNHENGTNTYRTQGATLVVYRGRQLLNNWELQAEALELHLVL